MPGAKLIAFWRRPFSTEDPNLQALAGEIKARIAIPTEEFKEAWPFVSRLNLIARIGLEQPNSTQFTWKSTRPRFLRRTSCEKFISRTVHSPEVHRLAGILLKFLSETHHMSSDRPGT